MKDDMNKRVAELRGDAPCEYPCGETPSVCDVKCANFEVKPYASDIACSMELWSEMKEHWDFVTSESCQRGNYVFLMMDKKVEHTAFGETEAEAITGAWLKWKEEGANG